jgi:hypothetical protein
MTEERHAELMELGKKAAAISGFWESSEGCLTFPEVPGGRQYRVTYVRYCNFLMRDTVGMIEADQDYPVKIGYDGSHPGDLRDHVPDLTDRATVAHLLWKWETSMDVPAHIEAAGWDRVCAALRAHGMGEMVARAVLAALEEVGNG